jgi:hypothetical protein
MVTGEKRGRPMTYHAVFDAAQQPFWQSAYNAFFILPAAGALVVFFPNLSRLLLPNGVQGASRTLVGWILLVVPPIIGAYVILNAYTSRERVLGWLREGHVQVTEGPVTDFVPMPYEGHALEKFTVRGHTFTYSDYILTPGFHNTASHGGPIREGLNVRVSFAGNLILRLEVAQ